MSVGRVFLRYLVGTVLVTVLVVAGVAVRVAGVAQVDQRAPAEAIVVLGAAQYDGTPSAVFQSRLDHAWELYRAGVAPVIITIGGSQEGDQYTEAQAGKNYLVGLGAPETAVVEVGEGNDTLVSLRAADAVLTEMGWNSVVLVTDPWHAFRARAMAEDFGLTVQISSVQDGPGARSEVAARYLTRETLGSLYYLLVGGSSGAGTPVT